MDNRNDILERTIKIIIELKEMEVIDNQLFNHLLEKTTQKIKEN